MGKVIDMRKQKDREADKIRREANGFIDICKKSGMNQEIAEVLLHEGFFKTEGAERESMVNYIKENKFTPNGSLIE